MSHAFYPFVENVESPANLSQQNLEEKVVLNASEVHFPARIAVYDDAAAAPRVVIVEPADVRA